MIARRRAAWILGIANVALLIPLLECERRMRRTGGPGIVPFELAGPKHSQRVLDKWGAEGQRAARASLVLDYPYLVTYSGLLYIGCAAASDELGRRGADALVKAGQVIAPAQIAAGAFDVVENTSLRAILSGRRGRLPAIARASSQAKLALMAVGSLYGAFGLASRLAPGR